jgi:hypothetical protein
VHVKKGFIAKEKENFGSSNPYPPLRIPAHPIKIGSASISAQSVLDSSIPFCSLYITTRGRQPQGLPDEEMCAWSVEGLLSFYRELVGIYKKHLMEVEGKDEYYYFIQPFYFVTTSPQPARFTLFRVPKTPLLFIKNFRSLAMPQDPKHIFLSGLLLVYKTDYITSKPQDLLNGLWVIDSEDFQKNVTELGSELLEVASLLRFKPSHGE